MNVGGMNLNNLPLTGGNGSNPTDSAMAQIGTKLVDGLLKSGELLNHQGAEKSQANGGLSIKEVIELIKFFSGPNEAPTARDAGLPEVVKMLATVMESNTKLIMDVMKTREPANPTESEADKFLRGLGMQLIGGSLNQPSKQDLVKEALHDLADIQKALGTAAPQRGEISLKDRIELYRLEDDREHRRAQTALEREKLNRELAIKEKELDIDGSRINKAIEVAGDFFADRRSRVTEDRSPSSRTAASVSHPPRGLIRVRCQVCGHEMVVKNVEDIRFCPKCGDPKTDTGAPAHPAAQDPAETTEETLDLSEEDLRERAE